MADNYLERKMEEYRRGGERRAAGPMPVFGKAGTASFEVGILRAFVSGFEHNAAVAAGVVKALRACGMSVSFAWADVKAGSSLAQNSGSRHYPMHAARALAAGATAGVDVIINVDENALGIAYGGKRTMLGFAPIVKNEVMATAPGQAVLYFLLPQSAMLRGRVFGMDADGALAEIPANRVEA